MMKRFLTALAFILCGCTCDDFPWENPEGSPVLTGCVTTIGGAVLPDALIVAEINGEKYEARTDSLGVYRIEEIDVEGSATVSASYPLDERYKGRSEIVTLTNNSVTVQNFLLLVTSTDVTVEETEEGKVYTVYLPDIVQEEKTETQIATYYVDHGSLEEDDELVLEAWYDVTLVDSETKAYSYTGKDVVVKVQSKSKSGSKTSKKPIKIEIKDLVEPKHVEHNGNEVEVASDTIKRITWFETTELGETNLWYPIMIQEDPNDYREALTFEPNLFKGRLEQIHSSYTIHYGSDLYYGGTFLDQYIAIIENSTGSESVNVPFEPYIYVPEGEQIILKGWQHYSLRSYKCGYATVGVKLYGDVEYGSFDRQHTGGSN